ncbi:MAG: hypothetical protein IJ783_01050 [Kiritimatiellae bacterium]|nr:hypothetical protein [Kiritimatiellia bacterium]
MGRVGMGGRAGMGRARARLGATALETLLAVAAAAACVYATVPDFRRVRDGLAAETAAWALRECDGALRHVVKPRPAGASEQKTEGGAAVNGGEEGGGEKDAGEKGVEGAGGLTTVEERSQATLAMIEALLADRGRPLLVWPPEADMSTLDLDDGGRCSIEIVLPGGERRKIRGTDLPRTCIR